jgi:hypothetical protein
MKARFIVLPLLLLALIAAGVFGWFWANEVSKPDLTVSFDGLTKEIKHDSIDCDGIIEAAIGTVQKGIISTCGTPDQEANLEARPIASMTKTITGLVVLNDFADKLDKEVTLDKKDVQIWEKVVAGNGSNIKIYEGEKLTLNKMLEGVFTASANNLADSIVYHFYGDLDTYFISARNFLEKNGLYHTFLGGDASGYDPQNKTTSIDMLKIATLAIQDKNLSKIVNLRDTQFPDANNRNVPDAFETEHSTTFGHLYADDKSYIGVKSGSTDEAGYNLSFARTIQGLVNDSFESELSGDNNPELGYFIQDDGSDGDVFVGVLMGGRFEGNRNTDYDFRGVAQLQDNFRSRLKTTRILKGGEVIGSVHTESKLNKWDYSIVVDNPVDVVKIKDVALRYEFKLDPISENSIPEDGGSGILTIFTADYTMSPAPIDTREEDREVNYRGYETVLAQVPCSVILN